MIGINILDKFCLLKEGMSIDVTQKRDGKLTRSIFECPGINEYHHQPVPINLSFSCLLYK